MSIQRRVSKLEEALEVERWQAAQRLEAFLTPAQLLAWHDCMVGLASGAELTAEQLEAGSVAGDLMFAQATDREKLSLWGRLELAEGEQ